MPKRVGFLYERMCDKDRIRAAIQFAAKGKHNRFDVKAVLADVDGHVDQLHHLLVTHAFTPSTPRKKQTFDICGKKWRTIEYVKFFPDGVIHTLMVMVLEPIIMRGMSHWCCASVPGRGGKHAMKRVKRILHNDPKGSKYVCKMDVRHYYHSVNRRRLIWALARKVKDKKFLKLVWDVLSPCEQGLAIGYYICQWLANYFLEPLDRFMTTLDGVKHTVRYMDDIVIFGPNKKKLHRARKQIDAFMRQALGLTMKGNWAVFPLSARPLDFVGYKFYRDHITLRKANFLRLTRQCRRVQKKLLAGKPVSWRQAASLLSRIGQLRHCDSYSVRVKYVDPLGIKTLKEVVRYESKRRQRTQQRLFA